MARLTGGHLLKGLVFLGIIGFFGYQFYRVERAGREIGKTWNDLPLPKAVASPTPIPTPVSFDWNHAPSSQESVVALLADQAVHGTSHPIEGTLYFVGQLQISQKIAGGYSVRVFDPFGDAGPTAIAFIATDQVFEPNQTLRGGMARYVGLFHYEGEDGFEHAIYGFQLKPVSR